MSTSTHTLKRLYTGEGIEGGVQPSCSCGWTGRVEHAWNDWQMTNVAEQEREHLDSVRAIHCDKVS